MQSALTVAITIAQLQDRMELSVIWEDGHDCSRDSPPLRLRTCCRSTSIAERNDFARRFSESSACSGRIAGRVDQCIATGICHSTRLKRADNGPAARASGHAAAAARRPAGLLHTRHPAIKPAINQM